MDLKVPPQTLGHWLADVFKKYSGNPALVVGGRTITYAELGVRATALSRVILKTSGDQAGFVGILASRSEAAYIGIVAAQLAGHAYVPLNPQFPSSRLVHMLRTAQCNHVVLGEECLKKFSEVSEDLKNLNVFCPAPSQALQLAADMFKDHFFVFVNQEQTGVPELLQETSLDDYAYLMFTSGTTGMPKGIGITQQNVCSYMRDTIQRYKITSQDRHTQMFDLTFDLSVHDVFVSLLSGACLCVVPESAVLAPSKFIAENKCTISFAVPSVAMFMSKMRMLKPNLFPSLRLSLFCGEALPVRSVEMWQTAAPNAVIENIYGPTETTIAITKYPWNRDTSRAVCKNGIVPIGWPYKEHRVRLVDSQNKEVPQGQSGELCLAGPQIAPGYFKDPAKTEDRFVRFQEEPQTVWYKTGDLVTADDQGCLYYLGRLDDQIKIRGYRIELQEIDKAIRDGAANDLALSVPKYSEPGLAESIHAFIQGSPDEGQTRSVLAHCQKVLPEYMVPRDVRFVDKLPLNSNGKIDRNALAGLLST